MSRFLLKGDIMFYPNKPKLDKTLFEIGIPLLHIVGGRVGMNTTYYEFAGDEPEVFEELRRD